MIFKNQSPEKIASLVHEKSTEILLDTGFCVPDADVLKRLEKSGFIVDHASQMVRITPELLDTALTSLPKEVQLYDREGLHPAPYDQRSCFMGAGTPVNVLDLESGKRRPATRQDVRQLVTLQDALPNIDIVRPTVTATDQGESSDLVEIAELLIHTRKPAVHRVLAPERVDAAFEMLAAVSGGAERFRARPNFATLYCPISPGYFTPENVHCMLRWAEHGVPVTLLSMAMGGASAPVTLLGELVVINTDILAWIVVLQLLLPRDTLAVWKCLGSTRHAHWFAGTRSSRAGHGQQRRGHHGQFLRHPIHVRRAILRCQAAGCPGGSREGGDCHTINQRRCQHYLWRWGD